MKITATRNGYAVSVTLSIVDSQGRLTGEHIQASSVRKFERRLRSDLSCHELQTKGRLSRAETKFTYT